MDASLDSRTPLKAASHRDTCILIPAYNPGSHLEQLIADLIEYGVRHIVVVDDGSSSKSAPVFERIRNFEQCHLLTHAVNLGKGRAIKTGLNYCLLNFPDAFGVVTADADGQHLVRDVAKVAQVLKSNPESLVLGVRDFDTNVPLRSKVGNGITKGVFYLLMGKYLSDTQTGLRGIPVSFMPLLLHLEGEGYEYEMNMLIATKTRGLSVIEERISTVYIEKNRSSHFNPLLDSMKIYFLLLRFSFSSLLASMLDIILFSLCFKLTSNILISIFLGRYTIGTLVNFVINRNYVFHYKEHLRRTIIRYYLFATVMGTGAFLLIRVVTEQLSVGVIVAKIVVEMFLFIISFTVQRDFIFAADVSAGPPSGHVEKGQ